MRSRAQSGFGRVASPKVHVEGAVKNRYICNLYTSTYAHAYIRAFIRNIHHTSIHIQDI